MKKLVTVAVTGLLFCVPVFADSFSFSNGTPDGKIGMASGTVFGIETETADDFVLASPTTIDSATFTGLVPSGSSISSVTVEIYRVFPNDSTIPPSGNVPTRANSPSDNAFASRDSSAGGGLSFTASTLASSFAVANSVTTGIHPLPNQTTGGDGAATGAEVKFTVSFLNPLLLSTDHYFFVPQVELNNGTFLWLSSPTPNSTFSPDLQTWIRNANLDPDWLRVGTDIVGGNPAPRFNAAFTLSGSTTSETPVPEPSSAVLALTGCAALLCRVAKRLTT